jgi:hypothetical protein
MNIKIKWRKPEYSSQVLQLPNKGKKTTAFVIYLCVCVCVCVCASARAGGRYVCKCIFLMMVVAVTETCQNITLLYMCIVLDQLVDNNRTEYSFNTLKSTVTLYRPYCRQPVTLTRVLKCTPFTNIKIKVSDIK